MNWGDGLLALLGICAFSLLWARKWELNAALLPLPVLGASVVWLWLFGMANQLALGGWLWFAGAAAALCLLLAPFSYGAIQVRVAEALCLLPIFGPEYILGVTLGCFLSNLLGSGLIDVVFGTSATLLACLTTYRLRNFRFRGLALLPALPPVIFNALIVGPEIAIFFSDTPATLPLMVWNGFTVAVGEVISCMVLGVFLVKVIESNAGLGRIFRPQH